MEIQLLSWSELTHELEQLDKTICDSMGKNYEVPDHMLLNRERLLNLMMGHLKVDPALSKNDFISAKENSDEKILSTMSEVKQKISHEMINNMKCLSMIKRYNNKKIE